MSNTPLAPTGTPIAPPAFGQPHQDNPFSFGMTAGLQPPPNPAVKAYAWANAATISTPLRSLWNRAQASLTRAG